MGRHAADLPQTNDINKEMQYRLVNRIVDSGRTVRVGSGTVVLVLLLLAIATGIWFTIGEVFSRVGN